MKKGVDETRAGGDRHDVAVTDGGDGHHREVHQIDDAEHLAIGVAQAVAVEIEHDESEHAERRHQTDALQQHVAATPPAA